MGSRMSILNGLMSETLTSRAREPAVGGASVETCFRPVVLVSLAASCLIISGAKLSGMRPPSVDAGSILRSRSSRFQQQKRAYRRQRSPQ